MIYTVLTHPNGRPPKKHEIDLTLDLKLILLYNGAEELLKSHQ